MKIRKHIIICSVIGASVCVASVFAMLPISSISSTSRGSDWMKDLSDETAITSISIPGSHDSGALHSIGDLSGKCQDLSISEQLKAGARYFDIRLQLRNNELRIVHGIVDQKLSFASALKDFQTFLNVHSSEGLIVSIKEESDPTNSSKTFEEALKDSLNDYQTIWNLDRKSPKTLKELRGKAYLVSRYKNNTIGLPAYEGWIEHDKDATTNTFEIEKANLHVQDYFKIKDIENKKREIVNCFDSSANDLSKLTMNFTSCYYLDSFPPTYAGTTAKIINKWVMEEVKNRKNLGITVSDFITSDLCEAIYTRNL